MRPRLLLTINCKFAVDFFARGLHTRTAVERLPLRQLGFLVLIVLLTFFHLGACIDPLLTGTLVPTAPGKSAPMLAILQSKIKHICRWKFQNTYTKSQTEIDLKKSKMKVWNSKHVKLVTLVMGLLMQFEFMALAQYSDKLLTLIKKIFQCQLYTVLYSTSQLYN